MEIVNKMVPEKYVSGVFLMEETDRLKSMMGKEFQSLGSLLKKKWRDKLDGDFGCCILRVREDLVVLLQNIMWFQILKESVGFFRELTKKIMSLSSNCIIKGSILKLVRRLL